MLHEIHQEFMTLLGNFVNMYVHGTIQGGKGQVP